MQSAEQPVVQPEQQAAVQAEPGQQEVQAALVASAVQAAAWLKNGEGRDSPIRAVCGSSQRVLHTTGCSADCMAFCATSVCLFARGDLSG